MNTITWLVIGHLVGDWVLQNDWMAKGKKTGFLAVPGLIHFLIYTLVILAVLFLSVGGLSPWVFLAAGGLIFITHWIIDATDIVERWMRFYGQTPNSTVRLMVDQTIHLLILTGLAVWFSGL